jgi:hypothetical protein
MIIDGRENMNNHYIPQFLLKHFCENGMIQYSNDNTVDYDYINYAPEGTYPLLSRANGKFILNPELQYYGNCYSTWDEDKTLG